jgi:hypothetical protein
LTLRKPGVDGAGLSSHYPVDADDWRRMGGN